jgi:hypothetical protein
MGRIRYAHILAVGSRGHKIARPTVWTGRVAGLGAHALTHVQGADIAQAIAAFVARLTKASGPLFARWRSDVFHRRILDRRILRRYCIDETSIRDFHVHHRDVHRRIR